jgi:hypothetical protein
MPLQPFEQRRRQTAAKLAALMLANAFIFQEQLSGLDERVNPIRTMLPHRDFITAVASHWSMIIEEINCVPIFKVARDILQALPGSIDSEISIKGLAQCALEIVTKKAALRHDLMGRIYHLLLLEAKYLGTYYTSIPAATLLLKIALDPDNWPLVDWSRNDHLSTFRISDLACGTGTLLMAASQTITDNFVSGKLREDERVEAGALHDLHKCIVEEMLYGYDVLPSAVHLTASTLALLAPEICFHNMHLYSLPMGRMQSGQIYLGSIDYISASTARTQLNLMDGLEIGAEDVATGDQGSVAPLPQLDLCVMNPPFVRSVGSNLLFGSMPDHRGVMQGELARRIRATNLSASSTVGLGSVFTAVADRHLKEGGRLALVLPAAAATGIAWGKTRALMENGYVLELLISSHDPERWNFSENTDLSEVLIIARKRRASESMVSTASARVRFANLWHNPRSSAHALALGESLASTTPADVGCALPISHGVSELSVGSQKFGEVIEFRWGDLRGVPWIGGAFAQTDLVRAAWLLRQGSLYFAGQNHAPQIPVRRLGEMATLGPDRRDIADGFTVSLRKTSYPALIGNNAETMRRLGAWPNRWLSPRAEAAPGRPRRDVGLLWPRAGSIMLAERVRLSTQYTLAVRMSERCLSNVWWPVCLRQPDEGAEKALALWLNSSPGLLAVIAHRIPTEGPWVQFKKPTLELLPVLDPHALSASQKLRLAAYYDSIENEELAPFQQMASDPLRAEIDDTLSLILDLPSLAWLRASLAEEPVICGRPRADTERPEDVEDALQLELL